jgi:uncharacterized protein YjbJ (UPF0337 family)
MMGKLPSPAGAGLFLHGLGTLILATSFISVGRFNRCRMRRSWRLGLSARLSNVLTGIPQASTSNMKEKQMDKDRIEGAAKQAKGAVKEAAGKLTGDAKLKAEGKTDKAAGKVQSAVGGLKDTLRGK